MEKRMVLECELQKLAIKMETWKKKESLQKYVSEPNLTGGGWKIMVNKEWQIIKAVCMRKGKNPRANEMVQGKRKEPYERYQKENTKEKF